ncbi:MAG: phosphatidate cytidylyltransferase [Deltaproteobacteria bacterium]|nr:phosphatidate cytidylyltransferase [Deltaproteobacteria bacterium]MBI3293177.1 phosphatidate cytidylyltransferase [Deltaproteobacteria bacterium]
MIQRLISGSIAGALLVAVVLKGGLAGVLAVVVVLAVMSYREYDRLVFEVSDRYRLLRICSLIVFTILALRQGGAVGLVVVWFSFISIAAKALFDGDRSGGFKAALARMNWEWLGYFYTLSLLGFVIPIYRLGDSGHHWLLLLFVIVFSGDSFAYFVGRAMGQSVLASKLSPKKTVEGAVGGLLGSLLFAYLWIVVLHPYSPDWRFWVVVVMVNVLGQLGDLFESLLKRSQREKDSGTFLPGHGGILDRIDGLAFASPFYYAALLFFLRVGENG